MHLSIFNTRYLDPGSTNLLFQLIAAGLVGGAGILIKIFWGRLKAFFTGKKYVPPQPENTGEETEDEQSK